MDLHFGWDATSWRMQLKHTGRSFFIQYINIFYFYQSHKKSDWPKDHRTGNKLLDIDGNFIKDHRTGNKLLDIAGNCIKDHRTGNKLFDIDGTSVKDHRTGKRIYDFNGSALLSYPYLFAVLHALDILWTTILQGFLQALLRDLQS